MTGKDEQQKLCSILQQIGLHVLTLGWGDGGAGVGAAGRAGEADRLPGRACTGEGQDKAPQIQGKYKEEAASTGQVQTRWHRQTVINSDLLRLAEMKAARPSKPEVLPAEAGAAGAAAGGE
eukprot:1138786-Pelagomonas_calceolata.AAC.4